MILFDFHALSVKSFNRKRRHIGIRIFIRIIYYPIHRYPDSKLSVLSIPTMLPPRVAIWLYARPIKSNLALLIAFGLEIFGLAFWHFFGLIGRVWPWTLKFGFNVVFWLYFGLFYTKVPFNTIVLVSKWQIRTEYAHRPIFRYHTLTVCYLLDCQCQCPLPSDVVWRHFYITIYPGHYDFFTKQVQAKFVVANAILC